ncbi:hypothetical protein [Novosphingobium sp. B 225]|uniref:hypothetical protein n=1 Tax=Novosphingobium sp. B 225 TaxID=1961849 RepID=UPI0020CE0252|nr:hypothetical protein [Novosphingobium sp. B 225]
MQIDPAAQSAMRQLLTRPVRRSTWLHLLSALMELAEGQAELISHSERAWASATFAGTRHRVVLRFDGGTAVEAGEQFIDGLGEHEFTIPRQLVADAAVMEASHTALPQPCLEVTVELLLLDDA